jgi:CRP/FNR family transcriptional regulator/CRP/FNR family cyclic AMP-dependent transcriptional regulator
MRLEKATYSQYLKTFPTGTVIFKEGDPGNEMYVIVDGEVEIRKATASDTAKTLIELKKGDIFGEMSLIEGKPRSATAVTTRATQLLCITEDRFDSVLQKNPDFSRKIIRMLSERLRRADAMIKSIISTNKQNQLLAGLYEFADEQGTSTFKGSRVNISRFGEWASQTLGITEYEIKSILETLKKKKLVKESALGNNEIIIEKR